MFWNGSHLEWTNHNHYVQSQACYQRVLKWQQLPHIWNDSSPHGSTCLSAVRTVAITGDGSEADMPHQYCHPARVLGVGVSPLKPGPVAWLAFSVYQTTVCHHAGCAGSESVLELSFPFCSPLFFAEAICHSGEVVFIMVLRAPFMLHQGLMKSTSWRLNLVFSQCWCNTCRAIKA